MKIEQINMQNYCSEIYSRYNKPIITVYHMTEEAGLRNLLNGHPLTIQKFMPSNSFPHEPRGIYATGSPENPYSKSRDMGCFAIEFDPVVTHDFGESKNFIKFLRRHDRIRDKLDSIQRVEWSRRTKFFKDSKNPYHWKKFITRKYSLGIELRRAMDQVFDDYGIRVIRYEESNKLACMYGETIYILRKVENYKIYLYPQSVDYYDDHIFTEFNPSFSKTHKRIIDGSLLAEGRRLP